MTAPSGDRYDAFLSYNSLDRDVVEELARRLRAEGLKLYLEVWELLPGRAFQPGLAQALSGSQTCVAFLGPNGLGPWQVEEIQNAIDRRVRDRDFHVIPVLLPGAERPRRGSVANLEFLINASWVEFLKTIDDRKAFDSLVAGITGIKPPEPPEDAGRWEGRRPYRGLEAFGPDDAGFFFGRDNLADWLVSGLRREVRAPQGVRFLPVLGPSGSGKSSVVLAGLLPRLARGAIDGSEGWPVVLLRPGDEPLRSLADKVVAKFLPPGALPDLDEADKLHASLLVNESGLARFAGMALRDSGARSRLLVVVDQFEEVFTYRPQDDEARRKFEKARLAFFANLLDAATAPAGKVAVVLTMRSDFLGHCAPFPRLNDLLTAHLEQVGPMQEHELREAIERPAFKVGGELEPGLTERLLADVEGQAGALPLLQFALDELWTRRRGRKLTRADYDALGGIAGALEHRADAIYAGLKDEDKETCQRIFLRLVQPGEGVEDTRRRVALDELIPRTDPVRAERVRRVIVRLTDQEARLVTTEGASSTSPGAIEVAHEALIRGWKKLRQWIEDNRAGMRTRDRLAEAAQEWTAAAPEKKGDYLYFGARLAEAREWAAAHRDDLGDLESVFLAASEAAHKEEAERERLLREEAEARARKERSLRQRFVAVAVVAGLFAVVAGRLGWLAKSYGDKATHEAGQTKTALKTAEAQRKSAVKETQRALAQERIAESRRLALLSDLARPKRLDQAMLLAVEASGEDTLEARGVLQRSLDDRPEVSRFLHVPEGTDLRVGYGPGGTLAAGYSGVGSGGVVLFDATGERLRPAPLEVKEGAVTSVAFGPEGTLAAGYSGVVVGVYFGGVVLFDAKGERLRPAPLEVKEGGVWSVVFGPEGDLAAGYAGVAGGGVVLFDAKGERLRPAPLEVKEGAVTSVAFGPGGALAAGYSGFDVGGDVAVGGVVLFDAKGERLRPAPLEVKEGPVRSVAYGPEGTLAAGYARGVVDVVGVVGGVVLFDATGERLRPAPLEVKEGAVRSVAYGPGGTLAAGYARGVDGGVVLFDAKGERLRPAPLEVKEGGVRSVAYGPGGTLAAGYSDVVVGVNIGGVVLFDATGERLRPAPLEVKEGHVWSVMFGPEGDLAAGYAGVAGGGVVLFDAKGERLRPAPLEVKEGAVTSVAFGPGGTLAAGYSEVGVGFVVGGVVLFDAKGERLRPAPLEVKEGAVWSVAYGPGGTLAAGFIDVVGVGVVGGVVLFDAKGERLRPAPLEVKEGGVRSVAYGPGGTLAAGYFGVVVGADFGGVVLFDATGERLRPAPLEVKEGGVKSVAYGPGGTLAAGYACGVVVGADFGGVVLFDATGERLRPAPLEVKEGGVWSVAFGPGGTLAAECSRGVVGGVMLFDATGERLRPAPLKVKEEEGSVLSVAYGPGGTLAAGYAGVVGGVVLFDADPVSWRRKAGQVANRNFTREEWTQFFPDRPYRRTIRSLPWPHDLPEGERKQAEAWEREHPEMKDAS